MLFEIFAIIIIFLEGVLCAFCYRLGIKDGSNNTNTFSMASSTKPPPGKAKIETDRYNAILDNINAYDGTGSGQRDVTP